MLNRRLISVGIFWKNQEPGGFGFTTHEDQVGVSGMKEMSDAISSMLQSYHENDRPEYTEAYLEQIEGFAAQHERGTGIDSQSFVLLAANLDFLAAKGRIDVDNWTGVQYMYGN